MCELRPMCRSMSHRCAHREIQRQKQSGTRLANRPKVVVAQIAPAVRGGYRKRLSARSRGEIETGKIVAALKKIGFAKVFDTVFAADLTAVEECDEFLRRLTSCERLPQVHIMLSRDG